MNREKINLRNSIIQLAIKGDLVKQKEQQISQIVPKPLQIDNTDFDIPSNWKWSYLGDVLDIARGGSPRPIKSYLTESKEGINWIKIGDTVKGNKFIKSTKEKIIPEGISKSRFVKKGDFLLSNSMSFGQPYILDIDGCIHDGWLVLSNYKKYLDSNFLYYLLSSNFVKKQFKDVVSGAVVNNLNTTKVSKTIIPIPPLEEQIRIVEKIEEILPKISEFDNLNEQFLEIKNKFPEQLRKSILQYATRGKLSKQNPNISTGHDLYKNSIIQKNKLIENGTIKRNNSYKNIDINHFPFDIPDTWKWVKLSDIALLKMGKTPPRSESQYWSLDIPWVSIADMVNNNFTKNTKEKISNYALEKKFNNTLSPKGTLIMSFKLTIGKVSILDIDAVHNEAIVSIFPFIDEEDIMRNYLFKTLPLLVEYANTKGAIKGKTLNSTSLNNLMIPLPSLDEQKVIVKEIIKFENFINTLQNF